MDSPSLLNHSHQHRNMLYFPIIRTLVLTQIPSPALASFLFPPQTPQDGGLCLLSAAPLFCCPLRPVQSASQETAIGKATEDLHVSNPVITALIYLTHRQLRTQRITPSSWKHQLSWVPSASLVAPTQFHLLHLSTGRPPEVRPWPSSLSAVSW